MSLAVKEACMYIYQVRIYGNYLVLSGLKYTRGGHGTVRISRHCWLGLSGVIVSYLWFMWQKANGSILTQWEGGWHRRNIYLKRGGATIQLYSLLIKSCCPLIAEASRLNSVFAMATTGPGRGPGNHLRQKEKLSLLWKFSSVSSFRWTIFIAS